MQSDTIVRVVKQPSVAWVPYIVGEVGYVSDVLEGDPPHIEVCLMSLEEGRVTRSGPIPKDCLAVETDPKWLEVYSRVRHNQQSMLESFRRITDRVEAKKQELARQYKLEPQDIQKIYQEMDWARK